MCFGLDKHFATVQGNTNFHVLQVVKLGDAFGKVEDATDVHRSIGPVVEGVSWFIVGFCNELVEFLGIKEIKCRIMQLKRSRDPLWFIPFIYCRFPLPLKNFWVTRKMLK